MGKQATQAREIVDREYQFDITANVKPDELAPITERACAAAGRKFGCSISATDKKSDGAGTYGELFVMHGPGGVVKVMNFMIVAEAVSESQSRVTLEVGDFKFQKGSLFSKPTINGGKEMRKFVEVVSTELRAA